MDRIPSVVNMATFNSNSNPPHWAQRSLPSTLEKGVRKGEKCSITERDLNLTFFGLKFSNMEVEKKFMRKELKRTEVYASLGLLFFSGFAIFGFIRAFTETPDCSRMFFWFHWVFCSVFIVLLELVPILVIVRRIFDKKDRFLSLTAKTAFVLMSFVGQYYYVSGIYNSPEAPSDALSCFPTTIVFEGLLVNPPFVVWGIWGNAMTYLIQIPVLLIVYYDPSFRAVPNHRATVVSVLFQCVLSSLLCNGYLFFQEQYERRVFRDFMKYIEKSRVLDETKKIENILISNLLPEKYVKRLVKVILGGITTESGLIFCDHSKNVVALTTDIVCFTSMARKMAAEDVVFFLNFHYSGLEKIIKTYRFSKLTTYGDAFLCFRDFGDDAADDTNFGTCACNFALEIVRFVSSCKGINKIPDHQLRIGVACGFLYVFLFGKRRFMFDAYGDALLRAENLEKNGVPGGICVCEKIEESCRDIPDLEFIKYGDNSFCLNIPTKTEADNEFNMLFINDLNLEVNKSLSSHHTISTQRSFGIIGPFSPEKPENEFQKNEQESEESDAKELIDRAHKKIPWIAVRRMVEVQVYAWKHFFRSSQVAWDSMRIRFGFVFCFSLFFALMMIPMLLVDKFGLDKVVYDRQQFTPDKLINWVLYVVFLCVYFVSGCLLFCSGSKAFFTDKRAFFVRLVILSINILSSPAFILALMFISDEFSVQMTTVAFIFILMIVLEFVPITFFSPIVSFLLMASISVLFALSCSSFGSAFELLLTFAPVWALMTCSVLLDFLKKFNIAKHFYFLSKLEKKNDEIKQSKECNCKVLRSIIPTFVLKDYVESFLTVRKNRKNNAVYNVNDGTIVFIDFYKFRKSGFFAEGREKIAIELISNLTNILDEYCDGKKICKIKSTYRLYLAVIGIETKSKKKSTSTAPLNVTQKLTIAFELAKRVKNVLSSLFYGEETYRIGICKGDFICSILGSQNLLFDCWGDSINYAARLCQTAKPNEVQVGEEEYELMKEKYKFKKKNELVEMKGFEEKIQTYTISFDSK